VHVKFVANAVTKVFLGLGVTLGIFATLYSSSSVSFSLTVLAYAGVCFGVAGISALSQKLRSLTVSSVFAILGLLLVANASLVTAFPQLVNPSRDNLGAAFALLGNALLMFIISGLAWFVRFLRRR